MSVRKIQVGQVWRMEGTGEDYLVTKLYTEALATFAILRKAGARPSLVPLRQLRLPDRVSLE